MKILIVYSSRTGNTRRLAEGIGANLAGFKVRVCPVENLENTAVLPEADAYLLGYWVDRGHADEKSQKLIQRMAEKKIGLFGTMGAYPYGKHARHTLEAVENSLPEGVVLIGSFLCQGSVDPVLLEKFKNLPADNPHAQTPEALRRQAIGAKHPNTLDAQYAAMMFRDRLEQGGEKATGEID